MTAWLENSVISLYWETVYNRTGSWKQLLHNFFQSIFMQKKKKKVIISDYMGIILR